MFEAKLLNGGILKKIVEAIKDIVQDVNIDISASGKLNSLLQLQIHSNFSRQWVCEIRSKKLRKKLILNWPYLNV